MPASLDPAGLHQGLLRAPRRSNRPTTALASNGFKLAPSKSARPPRRGAHCAPDTYGPSGGMALQNGLGPFAAAGGVLRGGGKALGKRGLQVIKKGRRSGGQASCIAHKHRMEKPARAYSNP